MKQKSKHIEKLMCLDFFFEGNMVLIWPEVNRMGCRAQCGEQHGPQLMLCNRASQEQLRAVGAVLAVRTSIPGDGILWVLIPWMRSLTTPKHEEIAEG